jgi:hypothetical protein
MTVTVTNSSATAESGVNPDIPVKTTEDGGYQVQHVNVDGITNTAGTALYTRAMGYDAASELYRIIGVDSSSQVKITGTVSLSSASVVSTKTELTGSSPTFATVGTSSATALSANISRKGAVFTNTSANTICLGIGVAAVMNRGIVLYPRGVWVMDEYTFTRALITAISDVAASNLAIQEFV